MDFKEASRKIKQLFQKYGGEIRLVFLALIFFWIYLFLYRNPLVTELAPVGQNGVQLPAYIVANQPDEAVNYWFIRALALGKCASIPIELQTLVPQKIHPRSTTIINDMLAPIGFPGIIFLYGSLLSLILLFLPIAWFNILAVSITPFLGALTPILLYFFLRRFFDKKIAETSALLLWIQPAWWYYASRPFQHSTLFLFLL